MANWHGFAFINLKKNDYSLKMIGFNNGPLTIAVPHALG
jgi:hypothetical protein